MTNDEFYKNNRGLVTSLVIDFLNKYPSFYDMKEEMMQEMCLVLAQTYHMYDKDTARATTYLTHRIRGKLCHMIRSKIRDDELYTAYANYVLCDTERLMFPPDMDDTFEFDNTIAILSKKNQELIRLIILDNLNITECAEKLGISRQACYNRYNKSMKLLRKELGLHFK